MQEKNKKSRGKAGRKSRRKPHILTPFTLSFREQLIFLKKQDSDKK